jgi:LAO/AO transport system kinase
MGTGNRRAESRFGLSERYNQLRTDLEQLLFGIARLNDPVQLAALVMGGDRSTLARLLSLVEKGDPLGYATAEELWPRCGRAYVVGITGAPGAGKSTLTDQLIRYLRDANKRVAVLAVDPSSPFSGGAILGDSVRMSSHFLDDDVFIRSMASRGAMGGLSVAVPEAIRILDASGYGWIIVETVGVGQIEVDIASAADTTVVVTSPGWGDAVQANKAGLLEVADIFVVNKSDRPGAADTQADLLGMLTLRTIDLQKWQPPVLLMSALHASGVNELGRSIEVHRAWQEKDQRLQRRRRTQLESELRRAIHSQIAEEVDQRLRGLDVNEILDALTKREMTVRNAVAKVRL